MVLLKQTKIRFIQNSQTDMMRIYRIVQNYLKQPCHLDTEEMLTSFAFKTTHSKAIVWLYWTVMRFLLLKT